jgi:hypothetical protein
MIQPQQITMPTLEVLEAAPIGLAQPAAQAQVIQEPMVPETEDQLQELPAATVHLVVAAAPWVQERKRPTMLLAATAVQG